jgi:large subunit ribosomal protein L33
MTVFNIFALKLLRENKMATERLTFVLSCTECKNKNYYFAKGKKKDYKVELNKFCKKCGKTTVHKESKASK